MIIRTLAIATTLAALVLVQLIGAAHQPDVTQAGPAALVLPLAATQALPTSVAEGDQRALEDLAAWPAAAGR